MTVAVDGVFDGDEPAAGVLGSDESAPACSSVAAAAPGAVAAAEHLEVSAAVAGCSKRVLILQIILSTDVASAIDIKTD